MVPRLLDEPPRWRARRDDEALSDRLLIPLSFGFGAPLAPLVGTNVGAARRLHAGNIFWVTGFARQAPGRWRSPLRHTST